MTTTNQVPSGLSVGIQNIFEDILERLGLTGVTLTDKYMSVHMVTSPDGQNLFVQIRHLGTNPATNQSGVKLVEQTITGAALSAGTTGATGVLVAGISGTLTMANKSGDVLGARVVTTGGTPSAAYAVVPLTSTTVKVVGLTSGNVVQVLDTSTVEVYNEGNPAA